MDVSDAGERAVIAALREVLGLDGPGDDCARVPPGDAAGPTEGAGPGAGLVATTDVVLASSHFPDVMTPLQRGAYAAAVNLSDLAACGARPLGLLVAFGLPPTADLAEVEEVARGVRTMADRHGCPVLGGDTKPAGELLLAGFALGRCEDGDGRGMPRSAAAPGQVLCVTGHLGGAGLGHELWRAGGEGPALERFLVPVPRLAEGRALAGTGAAACMDLSDGLAYSLHRMAEAADVGFRVDAGALPRFPEATLDHALYAAGDFELLCAVPEGRLGHAEAAVSEAGGSLTRIGDVTPADGGVVLVRGGGEEALEDRGYEHFVRGKTSKIGESSSGPR